MRHDIAISSVEEKVSARMAQSIREAFCGTIQASGLPPMVILELAAIALGSIYREAAAAHEGLNGCPCGWQPEEGTDIESLRTAVAIGAITVPGLPLHWVEAQGRA